MVRPITGLDLGLLALSRLDGTDGGGPVSEVGSVDLALRRLDPELARLYLPPGVLASERAPGGTMMARRVELGSGPDLVTLGPAFSLDRMALNLERQPPEREPEPATEEHSIQVLDASGLMKQAREEPLLGFRVRRASEAYRAIQPAEQKPDKS